MKHRILLLLLLLGCLMAMRCSDPATSEPGAADVVDTDPGSDLGLDPSADPEGVDAPDMRSDDGLVRDLLDPVSDAAAEVEDSTPEVEDNPQEVEVLVIPPGPWDVTESGPYPVGYRTEQIVYRPEGLDEDRVLRLCLWYPTLQTTGSPGAYLGFWRRSEVFSNATPAPIGTLPVLLFSHGHQSMAEQSFYLCEFFASHGWLVASPDHTHNTFVNLNDPIYPKILFLRPQDISAVLDHLAALDDEHPLYGMAGDDVVMSGHSFGGLTTLALAGAGYDVQAFEAGCAAGTVPSLLCNMATPEVLALMGEGFRDERVDLAIPQAPGGSALFGPELIADISIPVMLMTGALDRTTPARTEGDPIWNALDGADDIRVDFSTAGHFTFSNMCELIPTMAEDDGCGEGFIPAADAYRAINAYALSFARHHLWGDETVNAILDGTFTLHETIAVSHKP